LLVTILLAIGLLAMPAAAKAGLEKNRPIGWGPRTSKEAAKLVTRNGFEPRPENRASNRRVPGRKLIRQWRKRSEMPYARYVNGQFRGTTDEIIQWAAHKWGINTNIMRAVATVETWWVHSFRGDNGDSFGLYQVRRPYHCWGDCRIMRYYTAFNADYYGGIIRSYFDGLQTWLNRETDNGKPYRAGDLWGSMGAWYSGRWWGPPSRPVEPYLNMVKFRRAEKTWLQPFFVGK
jgi:autotransporter family porin